MHLGWIMVSGPSWHELLGMFRRARKWKVPRAAYRGDEAATTAFY